MKTIAGYIGLTLVMFVVLVGFIALKATPGKNPIMNRVTYVLWSPGIPIAKLIGNARIWPWPTEKGGLLSAVLLGGLGLFASGVWAAGGMVFWTIRKNIMKRKPNHYRSLLPDFVSSR